MKPRALCLPALGLILAGCETGGPINSSFDPLDAAGGFGAPTNIVDTGYRPGEFVTSVMDNTGFFKTRPEGDANADKLLPANTPMKVISDDGSFVKVELDSGELGWVSTVQVMGENETLGLSGDGGSEVQVWPPVEGDIPIDVPAEADPDVPVMPTDIDPDAPVSEPILPDEVPENDPAVELPPLPGAADEAPAEDGSGDDEATGDESAAASEE